MNWNEYMKCVRLMKSIWTKTEFLGDEYSIEVWYKFLKDLTFEQLTIAIEKYTLTKTFPPTIAELREQVADIQADKTDWSDGWQEVLTAVRRFGYMNESEAMEWMSPMTREVTKRLGWKQICESGTDGLTALRANFRMIYEQKQNAIKTEMQLPSGFNEAVKQLNNSMKLID